uniref:AAA+ ATPase domain-containing protein n=1 Tax=Fagus sylvatica TaxID=28930 RepID=A0A2N9G6B8_FAGSY
MAPISLNKMIKPPRLNTRSLIGMLFPATSTSEIWAKLGSTLASLMFVWAIIGQYCPYEIRHFFGKYTQTITSYFYPYIRIHFHEFSGEKLRRSDAYASIEAYLSAKSSKSAKKLKAVMGRGSKNLVLSMDEYEKVTDEFGGVKVWWLLTKSLLTSKQPSFYPQPENRYYRLLFHKKHRDMITESYLEYVVKEGKEIRRKNRLRKLYTNSPEKKKEIMEDLLTFSESKDYYEKIGKAWKRGYLLYGPPGTGKSTMIAAMANLLNYHIYDLELTAVKDNSELRKLLIETTSKSIIVIEDIDCSLDLTGQRKKKEEKSSDDESEKVIKQIAKKEAKEESGSKVTLSGLLNFIDGLWSACGGERLIVFTTNYVEKLDPALIRRGRMDKHIELSYCTFEAFKVLAKNYLNLEMHPMFDTIQSLIGETKITPADVAENLMPKSSREDAEKCLSNLIQALEEAKEEAAKKEKAAKKKAAKKEEAAKKEKAAKKKAEEVKEEDSTKEDALQSQKAAKEDSAKKKAEEVKEEDSTKEDALQSQVDKETGTTNYESDATNNA